MARCKWPSSCCAPRSAGISRPTKPAVRPLRRRRVEGDLEVFVHPGVARDDRPPRALLAVATALLRHLDALRGDGDGVELSVELHLAPDGLVELRGHRSSGWRGSGFRVDD